ncbi:tetratricopeptide repeat protein [Lysobacter sp. D1-1-M9]|uniref:tetratricopeptide repeat protein n=2 Tax=Novilysobacter TaxID=3382699 RepID=UPI002FCB43EA
MTAFVIIGVALALLALAYVARPLWRATPTACVAVVATLALLTGATYLWIGTPDALDPANRRSPETLPEAIAQLETELERDPRQIEGWRLLGSAYTAAARLDEARDAHARAVALDPEDPNLLVEAAESRANAAPGRRFDDAATAMLERAVEQQPMHQRARWFLGIARRQAGQHAEAAATWEPLLAVVEPGTAASLRPQIDAARSDAGLEPLPPAASESGSARSITVSVSLDPALAMRLTQGAVVYVIARQPGGASMPVAVERLSANALPSVITLDDADSPMPTLTLSQLGEVEITARISASGDAAARRGDFEAAPATVSADQEAAALMIDRVVE